MNAAKVSATPVSSARLWPRCGVSAAIFRDRQVLLVERGSGALQGQWSLPGGHIEAGELAAHAALRELREEAGVEAEIADLLDIHEVLIKGAGHELVAHYLIAVFWGRWRAGEPVAGSDAAAARFVALDEVASYPTTQGAAALIARAWRRLDPGSA
jgi:8-oxo-dGTP diphosphatase